MNKNLEFWGQIGDALISRYTVDLDKLGSVRCSPLINPFLLSYSGKHGISYRQEFKYNRIFTGDRLLRIVPRIGYNFKEKEFYWRVRSDLIIGPVSVQHCIWSLVTVTGFTAVMCWTT